MAAFGYIALRAVAIGVVATVILDLWTLYVWTAYGVRAPNYSLFGCWLGHLSHGRFQHDSIAASAPVKDERWLGWAAHYAIGVMFAGALLILLRSGLGQSAQPRPSADIRTRDRGVSVRHYAAWDGHYAAWDGHYAAWDGRRIRRFEVAEPHGRAVEQCWQSRGLWGCALSRGAMGRADLGRWREIREDTSTKR